MKMKSNGDGDGGGGWMTTRPQAELVAVEGVGLRSVEEGGTP